MSITAKYQNTVTLNTLLQFYIIYHTLPDHIQLHLLDIHFPRYTFGIVLFRHKLVSLLNPDQCNATNQTTRTILDKHVHYKADLGRIRQDIFNNLVINPFNPSFALPVLISFADSGSDLDTSIT